MSVDELLFAVDCQNNILHMLNNKAYVSKLCELFDIFARVYEEMKAKADLLVKVLRVRMNQLTETRNVDKPRRRHRVIELAHVNLSVIAAYAVISDQMSRSSLPIVTKQNACSHEVEEMSVLKNL